MENAQPAWLAHGVVASVARHAPSFANWEPASLDASIVEVDIQPWEHAPPNAEASGRPDLCFVRLSDRALTCFVGPGIQAYTAALQLACCLGVWRSGGMLIHGAGLAQHEGRGAVAALALSGGGKSTLSNLAEGFVGLSDETLLLWESDPPRISATPFRSTSTREPQPRTEPLRAFLVLEKSLEPRFERLPAHEGLKRLLTQAYVLPDSIAPRSEIFRRASRLAESVPAYRFAFPKAPEARDLLARFFEEELR